ncbi:MAG: hypothetical protein AAF488_17505 [Planctomycetota bacterium]
MRRMLSPSLHRGPGSRWAIVSLLAALVVTSAVTMGCTGQDGAQAGAKASGSKNKLDRGTFYVSIEETLEGEKVDGNIANVLFTKQMLLHGFQLVGDAAKAQYKIVGKIEYAYHKQVTFDYGGTSQHLEHQYKALAEITLTDTKAPKDSDKGEEFFDVPEPGMINGRTEKDDAKRDIRRYAATKLSKRIVQGKLLAQEHLKKLEFALGDPFETRTFNQVVESYVKAGREAVPYLLGLVLDDRPVKLKGSYPGLTEENKSDLAYFHIADLALRDILNRDSALALDSSEEYYKRVITGWFWAWEEEQGIPKKFQTLPDHKKKKVPAPTAGG